MIFFPHCPCKKRDEFSIDEGTTIYLNPLCIGTATRVLPCAVLLHQGRKWDEETIDFARIIIKSLS